LHTSERARSPAHTIPHLRVRVRVRVRGRRIALILLADSSSEYIAALFISFRILFWKKKQFYVFFLLHVLLKATLFANYEIVFVSETVTLCEVFVKRSEKCVECCFKVIKSKKKLLK
jgi:hypothetical protein